METLEKVLACYNITKEDISDKMADFIEKEVDLDELIGDDSLRASLDTNVLIHLYRAGKKTPI